MRYNKILKNKSFLNLLDELKALEENRIFCKHGIEHLLDVARTAYIISLERGLDIDKNIIYTTALLHDIGRVEQYKNGTEHHIAGCEIARNILIEENFNADEISIVLSAIAEHRNRGDDKSLSGIIYMADKLTRPCFMCKATDECNWSENKKNKDMRY
jgi:uncharacterized protein